MELSTLGLLMAILVPLLIDLWDTWAIRVAAVGSLALNIALMLLAGTRRHNTSPLRMALLWLGYKIQPDVGTYALSNLTLSNNADDNTSASDREQQLVAFWAPFLLVHLAGPDNITAYILEDGKISARKLLEFLGKVAGAVWVMYKYIYLCDGSGPLRNASSIMLVLGIAKYLEKVLALLRGNFDNIGALSDENKKKKMSTEGLDLLIPSDREVEADNEKAVLYAHIQFHVSGSRAMADSSVETDSSDHDTSMKIFDLAPENMAKVAEMEGSFMYDVLYTKASKAYTVLGYLLRLVSPVCTAIAFSQFLLYPKDCEETADIVITYILMVAAFILDVIWLLRALGSSWTYTFLNTTSWVWLHSAFLCSGRWRRLRRFLVSLNPCKYSSSRRLWSGIIGRYNLLAESTHDPSTVERLCNWLATKVGVQDIWNEFQNSGCQDKIPGYVKKQLFEQIQGRFIKKNVVPPYPMEDITRFWGQEALRRKKNAKLLKGINLDFFGRQFREDILIWHIGTTIFLSCKDQELLYKSEFRKGVDVLSEYLMFLLAVRPRMLPGLELRKLLEVTSKALKGIWDKKGRQKCSPCPTAAKKKLAEILRKEELDDSHDASLSIISSGKKLATQLLQVKDEHIEELLVLLFDVWVDKMLYASIQCNKDDHAKQLARGGELTTILWIVAEHAGPFQIRKPPRSTGGGVIPPGKNSDVVVPIKMWSPCGKRKKICCQDRVEPVCPDIVCCTGDYCCMENCYCCEQFPGYV